MDLMDDKIQAYKNEITELGKTLPEVADAYHQFTGECFGPGSLDAKTKQLIALGISLAANNEICTYYHVNEARSKGATDQDIIETVAVAGAVGAGHAFSQGLTRIQHSFQSPPIQ
ncbi:carboxymuconolactone decarboxylase family protein [Paenibacillus dokdonensis]|uniref:Carboxymuconolactone decarboxylase family protein n=1 Tax=Paenibacillus dokdonensis TaxID=2567944 RepID=A0ABU6GH70_9BACL|nr:carboxymuconolactone decarboxylase family protein [Paenibacillus dokdonensis]MEC0239076.1 carboxymuconolactone decarboxylase family protein [Paenibacillus dokdonensis]